MSSLSTRTDPSPAIPSPVVSGLPSIIGIVGGVGPYAGLDLQRKILEQTVAAADQDHLPVIAFSWPGPIPDRTAYLLGHVAENPAFAIVEQLRLLANAGATVAGIPCNTAHAPAIFDVICAGVAGFERPLRLVNMIAETAAHLSAHYPTIRTIGVLSTTGTLYARLYPAELEPLGYRVVAPDEALQAAAIHPAIYDPVYGLKATGTASARAGDALKQGLDMLCDRGAEAIILACTELPLVFPEREYGGRPLIDPALALARALVQAVDPKRLKPWGNTI